MNRFADPFDYLDCLVGHPLFAGLWLEPPDLAGLRVLGLLPLGLLAERKAPRVQRAK